jgi:hypothetical protein
MVGRQKVQTVPKQNAMDRGARDLGKVIRLDGGYRLNIYAEAQPLALPLGAPNYQAFTGIALQSSSRFTNSWHLF